MAAEWQQKLMGNILRFVRWLQHHYRQLLFIYHCLHIRCYYFLPHNCSRQRSSPSYTVSRYQFKMYRVIPHFQSGRFWYASVHKLTTHKEIWAWHRRGLVYQPDTGRHWKQGSNSPSCNSLMTSTDNELVSTYIHATWQISPTEFTFTKVKELMQHTMQSVC